MNELERIREIIKREGLTQEGTAMKAGIKPSRLKNLLSGQGKLSIEELQKFGEVFPEYKMWLAYGEELPEAGQISPLTKSTLEGYKKAGGD